MDDEQDQPENDQVERAARYAFSDVPETDLDAKDRARERLRGAIAQEADAAEPAPKRGRLSRIVAAVAALGLAIALVLTLLPSGPGGPSVTAAQELRRMSRVASVQDPPLPPANSRYPINQQVLLTQVGQVIGADPFTRVYRATRSGWVRDDGSGRVRTVVDEARFASPDDQEVWRSLGRPSIVRPGDVTVDRYGPGELQFFDLDGLPTQVDALRRALRSDRIGEFGEGPDNMLSAVGQLLSQPDASPELRAALFELASTIEGVRLLPDDTEDPLGRSGVGVALASGPYESQMIVDPSTSRILALVDRPLTDEVPGPTTWTAFLD